MQQSLFSTNSATHTQRSGFRLDVLELYNWGTFNDQVWTIEPRGETSLLTGENGSGKSTIVDALLTLLVSNRKRNYNQAAGEGKRERSEMSYMRGAYGRLQAEEGYSAKVQYLRDKDNYSVLLTRFYNEKSKQTITLAQVFWLTDGLHKFHVVATQPLSIQEHFTQFEEIGDLKKRLRRTENVTVEDQFSKYSQQFRKRMGLREKALDLFNQTVTIKEIGKLNDFVRQHMLKKTNAQEKVTQLEEHFENLMTAYQALQKAKHQLEILTPLTIDSRKYESSQAEIKLLTNCQEVIPAYFAGRKWKLLNQALAEAERDCATVKAELAGVDGELHGLRAQETSLNIAINSDETGIRIRELENEIKYAAQSQERKRGDAKQYNQIAKALGFKLYENETAFVENRERAAAAAKRLQQEQESAAEALRHALISDNELSQKEKEVEQELDSLRGRTSQIPERNLRLRDDILNTLSISPADVPFVGELLKVKENEHPWQGAIERLLHTFGLRLLVPERHYNRFAQHVNKNHLNGRIVFHRIPEDGRYRPVVNNDKRALFHKLEIKPDTPHYDWLQNELVERYNYTCCDNMSDFERSRRAITQNGLSKSGGKRNARFEKDDRRRLDDRRNYILGWQNKEKIDTLEAEFNTLQKKLTQASKVIKQAKESQERGRRRETQLNNLVDFESFAGLDWRRDALQIEQLNAQKQRLVESSNQLQQLQAELDQIKQKIRLKGEKRDRLNGDSHRLEHQISGYKGQIKQAQTKIRDVDVDNQAMESYVPKIKEMMASGPITLSNVDDQWHGVNQSFQQLLIREQRSASQHQGRLVKLMQEYKNKYGAETADFDASVQSIKEFDREKERIERDDLPRYAERFRQMRDEKVIEAISLFHSDLQKHTEEIEENIDELNTALSTIEYTPDTYIQLKTEQNRDQEIREFRQMLRDSFADVGKQRSEEAYEASFNKVRKLITRFKDEPRWTQKVTDVRQWLNFAAIERYTADDSEKHYYSDSSGKSGGQKAKLAYTILASAITFQFNADQFNADHHSSSSKSQSFRFVVVDEAFSRSDENNSRYAMQLFKKLNLQLLVVTPNTGLQIVEPFIDACHYVWNNAEGNQSKVTTMGIDELHQNGKSKVSR